MKTSFMTVLLCASVSLAADRYYIVVDPATTNEVKSFVSPVALPVATPKGHARMEVTKAAYNADAIAKPEDRLKGIDPAKIQAALAAAKSYQTEDHADLNEISPEVLKAVVAAIVKSVNARLPATNKITAAEIRQNIKDALP
jgi:hypothetical protein